MSMDITSYQKLFACEAKKWHKEIWAKVSSASCHNFTEMCSCAAGNTNFLAKMRILRFGGSDIRRMNTDPQGNLVFSENSGSAFRIAPFCYLMTARVEHTETFVCCGIGSDGKAIGLGDIQSDLHIQTDFGDELMSIQSSSGTHSEIHFLDDTRFLSGCGNNICYLWDIKGITQKNAANFAPVQGFYGGESEFLSLDYNHENHKEFAASFSSDCIKIFNLDSKRFVKSISMDTSPAAMKYFPDNKSLISYNKDASITHVDIGTGRVIWKYQLENQAICIPCLDCTQSGRFVFFQSPASKILSAYDIFTGKVLACTEKIVEQYTDIKRSHDGRLIYACCKKPYIGVVF